MKKYVISDIHGCSATFNALLKQIDLQLEDELYLLGDFIDRGPDAKGVIDIIFFLQEHGHKVYCLRGNHEQLMLDAIDGDRHQALIWLRNGGHETLDSFDPDATGEMEKKYLDFFYDLPYYFEVDQYILVHAGLNFLHPEPLSDYRSMMWIRNWYEQINEKWLDGRIIVHGHTPKTTTRIELMLSQIHQRPVIGIDGGCVYENGLHHLCAFELMSQELIFQKNIEDE